MITDITKIDADVHAPTEEQMAFFESAFPANDATPKAFRHRSTLTAAEIADEVTTLGWDTTYVLRVKDVNAVLAKATDVPNVFNQIVDPNENYAIQGSFGAWQISLGGSGGIIFLQAPITQGTMTLGKKNVSMANSTVHIAVKLKYIKQTQPGGPSEVEAVFSLQNNELLEIDDLNVDVKARSEADPAVVVNNLTFAGTPPPTMDRALMVGALDVWFNANISLFAYIFATVNLNQNAAQLEFQWLKPTDNGYAYFDGIDEDSAYFGVLCMTGGRSTDGLSYQLAPNSIPRGSRAGFNISMQRYMQEVILPAMGKGFPHASASSFTLRNNETTIENTEDIRCDDIKVGAIWYTPYIKNFVLQVVGSEIQIKTKTVTQISPGILSVVESTTYQTIVVVEKPDGSQTLDFKEVKPPTTTSFIDKASWVIITEIIVSIAGVIALGVAKVVIKGAVKIIIACVIIGIVFSLAAATPALIAAVAGGQAADKLPPITLMVLNSTSPVHWPSSSGFVLDKDGVHMNGAFQMGGNPNLMADGLA